MTDAVPGFDVTMFAYGGWEHEVYQAADGPGVVVIHGVALTFPDFLEMAAHRVGFVWSPRSNFELYGQTADVAAAKDAGVTIALAPAGGFVASVPYRYAIGLWRLRDGKLLNTLYTSFTGAVSSLAFNPAGNLLATGHYDGAIRIWDIGSGQAVVTMQTEGVVQSLAFSPDGSLLASGSSYQDSAVRLWKSADGTLLRTLEGHTAGVEYLLFSPAGGYLVSASYDGSLRLWGIRP